LFAFEEGIHALTVHSVYHGDMGSLDGMGR
jgi:hypothetical protein